MKQRLIKRSDLAQDHQDHQAVSPFVSWIQWLNPWHQGQMSTALVDTSSNQGEHSIQSVAQIRTSRAADSTTDSSSLPLSEHVLETSAPPDPPDPGKPPQSWRWTLICLAALGVISGMGAAALVWLISLPPAPECKESVRPSLDMELLYCAQQSIQAGGLPELIAGLALLKQWSPDDPLYAETEKLAEEWSKQVLTIARNKVANSDLEGALAAVSHIPRTTPVYEEAQTFAKYWKQQWQEGETIDAKAQEALKNQDWTRVSELIAAMADLSNAYWNTTRANALAQQLGAEKQARQVLSRARNVAAGGRPEQLGEAIEIAQTISHETHTWQTVRQDLRMWSQTLLSIGLQRWEAGDRLGAVAALKAGPDSTTIPELQDLAGFSQAYQLLHQSLPSQQPSASWFPSLAQVWKMLEAKSALEQVKPDSPFYAQAQAAQQTLEAQLDDGIQLYYATLSARLGQHSTLALAIEQAQQIAPDRPRRIQAQTLIAYWRDEIERIEDQPYLDTAIALAQPGEISDLQAAIAEASRILQGRSLRNEAQGRIATWQTQIETLEDQPILDRARSLASDGQLGAAIETAATIRAGRALYASAQAAIYDWETQLIRESQLAIDRPILDRARSLAASGDLSGAIRVASQIGTGRVLSGEAQALIADWEYQLRPPQQDLHVDESTDKEDLEDSKAIEVDEGLIRTLPPNLRSTPSQPTPFGSPTLERSPVPSLVAPPQPSPSAPVSPILPGLVAPDVVPSPSQPTPVESPLFVPENLPSFPADSSVDGDSDEQYDENSQE